VKDQDRTSVIRSGVFLSAVFAIRKLRESSTFSQQDPVDANSAGAVQRRTPLAGVRPKTMQRGWTKIWFAEPDRRLSRIWRWHALAALELWSAGVPVVQRRGKLEFAGVGARPACKGLVFRKWDDMLGPVVDWHDTPGGLSDVAAVRVHRGLSCVPASWDICLVLG